MAAIGLQTTSKKGGDGRIDFENADGLLHYRGELARERHGLNHMGTLGSWQFESSSFPLSRSSESV